MSLGQIPTRADLERQLQVARAPIAGLLSNPSPPRGCGSLSERACWQRALLVAMGLLDPALYGLAGSVGGPAIRLMQRGLGVSEDGIWGVRTQAALERLYGAPIPQTAPAAERVPRPELAPDVALPPPAPGPGATAGAAGLGLGMLALVVAALVSLTS